MEILNQNWLWIGLALGAMVYFMFGGRGRFGHGGHGGFGHGGFGHGGFGHGEHHERDGRATPSDQAPAAVIDAVSGAAVRSADALTSVYRGQVYYFSSKDNRDRFEAAPDEFAAKAAGSSASSGEPSPSPRRRHHGC